MDDALLGVRRDRRFRFLHGEDHVLLVLRDLGKHCQDQHIDRACALSEERCGMITIARRDEGCNHLAQMFACQARYLEMWLYTPFARYIFLERCVDALKDT